MMLTSTLLLGLSAATWPVAGSSGPTPVKYRYTATGSLAVASAAATAMTLSPTSNVKGKAFDRLAIIWLENTDYDMAIGDPNFAWLAKKGITLTNYFAVTHPSQPNYVAAISGDYYGMNEDDFNFVARNVSTVIDLLEQGGISWSEYQEDLPYSGFQGFAWVNQCDGRNDYVRKHNPAVIHDSVASSLRRLAMIKNMTLFERDLAAGTLPQWMFITPNMTSDGHDTTVTVAGQWTRDFLEPLLQDRRFMDRTLVLVTFDENETYAAQNRVLGILLGDAMPSELAGTTDDSVYSHYSEISSVCANWDLPTLGRWDVGANVWRVVADQTGDKLREWPTSKTKDAAGNPWAPLDQVMWNLSYDGVFNIHPAKLPRYPQPNLDLVNAAGRKVADSVKAQWRGSKAPTYYKDSIQVPDGYHPPEGFEPVL